MRILLGFPLFVIILVATIAREVMMIYGTTSLIMENKERTLLISGDALFAFRLGELSFSIADIPSEVLTLVLNESDKLYDYCLKAQNHVWETLAPFKVKRALSDLSNSIYAKTGNSFWSFILLELPFSMHLTECKYAGYKLHTKEEVHRELKRRNKAFSEIISNFIEFYNIPRRKPYIQDSMFYAELWSYYLESSPYEESSEYHAKLIKGCISHIAKIRKNAQIIMEIQPHLIELNQIRSDTLININSLPKCFHPGFTDIYDDSSFVSILGCICLEQIMISQNTQYIKRCKMCGKAFCSSSANSEYCDYPNAGLDLMTCSQIIRKKTSKQENPLYNSYNRSRKTYLKWKSETINTIKQVVDDEELCELMIKEITELYHNWDESATSALLLYRDQDISKKEAEEKLAAPYFKDRAPTYYSYLTRQSLLD